jgi:hypothetical protein
MCIFFRFIFYSYWVIPKGPYCYRIVKWEKVKSRIGAKGFFFQPKKYYHCPYWKRIKDLPEQENGFCGLLNMSDVDMFNKYDSWSLLWDQCKECGIKEEDLNHFGV